MAYWFEALTARKSRRPPVAPAAETASVEEMLAGVERDVASPRAAAGVPARPFAWLGRVSNDDLAVMSRQLATLISSGIPIVRGLHLLRDLTPNRQLADVLAQVVTDVQVGSSLSEAFGRRGRSIPRLYSRLLEMGESTGNLEPVLRQVATYLEKEAAVARQVRSALAYPAVVLSLSAVVLIIMLTVALPPLTDMFGDMEVPLPLPTRVLLGVLAFLSQAKLYLLGGAALLGLGLWRLAALPSGRLAVDRLILRLPLVGRLVVHSAVGRMCRGMTVMLRAGLPVPDIMDQLVRTQGNRVLAGAMEQVRDELYQGEGLSEPMARQGLFPPLVVQMVRVGEETGALEENVQTLADFYEVEVDRSISALGRAIEPALTILVGLVVALVAISMIMPMYSLVGALR